MRTSRPPEHPIVAAGRPTRIVAITAAVVSALVATGCAGSPDAAAAGPEDQHPPSASPATAPPDAAPPATPPTSTAPERDEPAASTDAAPHPEPEPARAARATGHLDVHDAPGAAAPMLTLEPTTSFGSPTVLPVLGEDGGWLEVGLPVRPNGTTGWVHRDDVEVTEIDVAVEVDLERRELTVRRGDEVVLTTPVAIGDAEHPTPPGTFAVTDKLDTGDPDGPYGPFAIGLSARSDVLTEFAGGDGQIGIHGTDTPASIGQAASHGCVRVPNDVVTTLAELLPLGTPVTVT